MYAERSGHFFNLILILLKDFFNSLRTFTRFIFIFSSHTDHYRCVFKQIWECILLRYFPSKFLFSFIPLFVFFLSLLSSLSPSLSPSFLNHLMSLDQYYQYQYDQCQYRHSCCYQYQYDQCQYRHCLLLLSVSTERVEQRLTRELQRAASTWDCYLHFLDSMLMVRVA